MASKGAVARATLKGRSRMHQLQVKSKALSMSCGDGLAASLWQQLGTKDVRQCDKWFCMDFTVVTKRFAHHKAGLTIS